MKRICVITATRAEYGLLYPLLKKIKSDDELELQLIVSGTHLSEEYGFTKKEIVNDGFSIAKEIHILDEDEGDFGTSKNMGNAMIKLAEYLKEHKPDMAVILGDRYEMMAFAIAFVNAKIPIAHLNGGETTEGMLDEVYRHCITKMSYLHFTNCKEHRKRVIQLGEEPQRVFNVGDICVDNILNEELLEMQELENDLGISLAYDRIGVVTYHPVTLDNDSQQQLEELLVCLEDYKDVMFIITKANADKGGIRINRRLEEFANQHENILLVDSLGRKRFLSLLKYATIMVGNSSSGIYEAPLFGIPTVNIGERQKGRIHGGTVLDCVADASSIKRTMEIAFSNEFQQKCIHEDFLFGDGHTAERIIKHIKDVLKSDINIKKKFYNLE